MINNEFLMLLIEINGAASTEESMKNHTSFRIGGNADCYCEVKDTDALRRTILLCRQYAVPYFIIGLGSNLLVSDKGIEGLVIRLGGEFNEITLTDDNTVRCGAGSTLARLCNFAKNMSLSGLEFAWGIPGSVGGAIYMNAGAYGGEIKDAAFAVDYMDAEGNIKRCRDKELDFSYRHSFFTDTDNIILRASFRLTPAPQDKIAERMQELMDRRKEKQPINHPSAGSVFKRPKDGYAAALIEECGLKGCEYGGAQVSPKHAGFIVNDNGATAEDVLGLIEHIKKTVKEKKNTELCCEVRFIGRK